MKRGNPILWTRCLYGVEPAEALSTTDREHLIRILAARRMTTAEIATHTRLTAYTVDRIQRRIADQAHAADIARVLSAWVPPSEVAA